HLPRSVLGVAIKAGIGGRTQPLKTSDTTHQALIGGSCISYKCQDQQHSNKRDKTSYDHDGVELVNAVMQVREMPDQGERDDCSDAGPCSAHSANAGDRSTLVEIRGQNVCDRAERRVAERRKRK